MLRNLRLWRSIRRISQAQLARMVGVSRPLISAFEAGAKPFNPDLVQRIAGALGVDERALTDRLTISTSGSSFEV